MHKGEILNININKHLYGKSLNRDCIPRAFLPVLHKFFHYIMQLEEMSYPFFFQLLYSSTIFCHQKGVVILRKVNIRGRQLFQIMLNGSCALNILCHYPVKLYKNNHLK